MYQNSLTIVLFLQVLVKDRVILHDVLSCGRTDRSPVSVEKLRLEVSLPKLRLGQLIDIMSRGENTK